jgi:hypothetical protein
MTKGKVPKRIAGIKLPKTLRKGAIGAFLATPAGQVLAAEGLLVVAGVLAVAMAPSTKVGHRLREALTASGEAMLAAGGGKGARHRARRRGAAIGAAVQAAVSAYRESLTAAESELEKDEPHESRPEQASAPAYSS